MKIESFNLRGDLQEEKNTCKPNKLKREKISLKRKNRKFSRQNGKNLIRKELGL